MFFIQITYIKVFMDYTKTKNVKKIKRFFVENKILFEKLFSLLPTAGCIWGVRFRKDGKE